MASSRDAVSELDIELALDRVEAELARELPGHVRAFAAAYRVGAPIASAPAVAGAPTTVALARRALAFPALASRGVAMLRLAAPLAIERDPVVATARAQRPTWAALDALTAARDAASHARFGRGLLALFHALGGAPVPEGAAIVPPAISAWTEEDVTLDARTVETAWRELARRHGITGHVTIARADARPRAFIVEPAREVIIVVPERIATPAARFAVLHELGHALANLVSPAGLPRALDEAVAAYAARLLEMPDTPWFSIYASAARARRTLLAQALDAIERGQGDRSIAEHPPWALWHDPGAQALYVEAERIADRLWSMLGASPAPGALAHAIAVERARIDASSEL